MENEGERWENKSYVAFLEIQVYFKSYIVYSIERYVCTSKHSSLLVSLDISELLPKRKWNRNNLV